MIIEQYAFGYHKHEEMVQQLIGRQYGLIPRLRMGGTGSERMVVQSGSAPFEAFMAETNALTYANIVIRPKGILVILARDIRRLAWVIPYRGLRFEELPDIRLIYQDHFLSLDPRKGSHWKFIGRVQRYQREYKAS